MIRALLVPLLCALTAARALAFVTAVESVGLTVSDTDRSVAFYTGVLGFERVSDIEVAGPEYEALTGVFGCRLHITGLRLGDERIELTEFVAPRGRPAPADAHSNDRWFQHVAIVVRDMDRAYAALRAAHVEHASTGPQRLPDWNPNAGGIRAFYFKDPDGHPLEIIWFPPGRGDPRWQRPGQGLFLGIDHTAIVVADTMASLRFYRDVLGLRVAGESENYGTEQEHLNNVFGARLHITGLRAATGPGIEFLEYLAPGDGRPYPIDEHANDLVHWQTRVRTATGAAALPALREARATFVSPGEIVLPAGNPGFARGVTVRDPDGHVVQVVGP
jgi:catechol 2,3-dioxygenase-like lactoylglutathione lyase family enzyme